MIELARSGSEDFASLKEIADRQGIPHKYLESIMTALAKAGLVEGSRGKNGGYRLTRPPEEYTAAEILKLTETSFAAASCTLDRENSCPRADSCPTLPMWRALDETIENFLKGYTLANLVSENASR